MARPLAFIHCGLADASEWDPLLEVLGSDIEPILIELPGHGSAEDWAPDRAYADQAIEIALDDNGCAAIALDRQDRVMLIKRHGNQFAGRILTEAASATVIDGVSADTARAERSRTVTLKTASTA